MLKRPALLLRLEEVALFCVSILLYSHFHFGWGLFALLFLAPDLFMLGYLVDDRVGASLYNLGHSLFLAIPLFGYGYFQHHPLVAAIGIIWVSHIAFDRLLGYGFKYPTTFKDTHLQHLG